MLKRKITKNNTLSYTRRDEVEDEHIIEIHSQKIRDYCTNHGLNLTGIYKDRGIGVCLDFNQLLKDIREDDIIIISDLFILNVMQLNELMNVVTHKSTKSHFICLSHKDIDTQQPYARFSFTTMIALRQWEKEMRQEALKEIQNK